MSKRPDSDYAGTKMMATDFELKSALIDSAAGSPNTDKAYRQAREHFKSNGGLLPATEEMVDRYVRTFAGELSVNTLQLRVAAIAKWHQEFGFPDPTKGKVKRTMKGIRALFNKAPKKALPIAIEKLRKMIDYLDTAERAAISAGDFAKQLAASRNRALVLIGFWRAFRSDELSRIEAHNITVIPDRDMRIFLRKTKHDRDALGQEFIVPALIELCPVRAYTHWLEDSGIHYGPVFRPITRWGRMADEGLSSSAIGPILRRVAEAAGVEQRYTSHSFRHGFANWAIDEGWDLISMMRYVGWKSVQNAQGYVQPKFNFGKLAIGQPASLSAPRWEPGHGEVFPGIVERLEGDE